MIYQSARELSKDKQTERQMKGQSENAYLPKFADLYVKLKL